ncbi:MAG: DUF6503 family protein [Saprospiraceae bacterium]
MRKTLIYTLFILIYGATAFGQNYSSIEILIKSINYHDPNGLLLSGKAEFDFRETRPKADDRYSKVILDPRHEYYEINRTVDNKDIVLKRMGNEYTIMLDGSEDISQADIEKYRLTEKRADFMKNYYRYLWFAPMVLLDPGTILDETVVDKDFFGLSVKEIKVTYKESVGKDIWYFYFEPITFRMVGYRFYHKEANNDGEYILLEDEATFDSVKLPKIRKWYTHKEDKFLGADHLISFKVE